MGGGRKKNTAQISRSNGPSTVPVSRGRKAANATESSHNGISTTQSKPLSPQIDYEEQLRKQAIAASVLQSELNAMSTELKIVEALNESLMGILSEERKVRNVLRVQKDQYRQWLLTTVLASAVGYLYLYVKVQQRH